MFQGPFYHLPEFFFKSYDPFLLSLGTQQCVVIIWPSFSFIDDCQNSYFLYEQFLKEKNTKFVWTFYRNSHRVLRKCWSTIMLQWIIQLFHKRDYLWIPCSHLVQRFPTLGTRTPRDMWEIFMDIQYIHLFTTHKGPSLGRTRVFFCFCLEVCRKKKVWNYWFRSSENYWKKKFKLILRWKELNLKGESMV